MRVVVTGSDGRLGAALAAALDKRSDIDLVRLGSPRTPGTGRRSIPVDIADRPALAAAIHASRPDVVVHLAAIIGGNPLLAADGAHRYNVAPVETVTRAAAGGGAAKVVLASSAAVYGDKYRHAASESSIPDPVGPYALSKLAAEEALAESAGSGLQTVALRIFNLAGPGFDSSLVNRLRASRRDAPVELVGWCDFVRDYVHVDDAVDAVVACIDTDLPGDNEVLNIASGIATSNERLVGELGRTGEVHYMITGDVSSFSVADIGKARDLLGFSPRDVAEMA